tara:strand:- start:7 stop:357 length:351 start_codon:yes stop_codon:yes gene_type:complete
MTQIIELVEINKTEKLFKLYKKMKNKKENINDIILFYYVDLIDTVTYLLTKRKSLIINYYRYKYYVPTLNDFYNSCLFQQNRRDICNYYKKSQQLVDHIINNWDHFNPIINTLLFD